MINGFAPTQGLISRAGLIAISMPKTEQAPMRKPKDAAIMANYMWGFDAEDLFTTNWVEYRILHMDYLDLDGLKGARIGVLGICSVRGRNFRKLIT